MKLLLCDLKDSGKRNGAVAAAQCSQMHISYQTETAGTDVDDAGAITATCED